MNTIEKIPHELCTGCGACYNKCPFGAIEMGLDSDGFISPAVNPDRCRDCGLCLGICPAEHPVGAHEAPEAYAVMAEDKTRKISSSGGMFTLLAEEIFKLGGVVSGARYSEDFKTVYHTFAGSAEELAPLRGSKYVQSDTGDTYGEAKRLLDEGRYLLYTGCPCQIAGLYAYLGKDYERLFTADLICHGSNSVTAFRSFVEEYADGREIEKLDFRENP